jgi:hypothetical protein
VPILWIFRAVRPSDVSEDGEMQRLFGCLVPSGGGGESGMLHD